MRFYFTVIIITLSSLIINGCLRYDSYHRRSYLLNEKKENPQEAIKYNPNNLLEKYKGNDAVFIHYSTVYDQIQIEYTYKIVSAKYLIINKDNEQLTTLSFPKGSSSSRKFYAVIRNPDGWVKFLSIDDLTEIEENGDILYKIAFPNIVKGSIVEYGYEVEHGIGYSYSLGRTSFVVLPLQLSYPCINYKLTYTIPTILKPYVQDLPKDLKENLSITNDKADYKTCFIFEKKNVDPVKYEPYSEDLFARTSPLVISLYIDQMGRESTFQRSVESVWNFMFYKNTISKKLKYKVDDIIKNCKSRNEKLDSLLTYLRREYKVDRYFDISRIDYDDVFESKRAPEKALVAYFQALLNYAGVESSYVLATEKKWGDISGVNHSIEHMKPGIYVSLDNGVAVVFPFYSKLPYYSIPVEFAGQKALRISPAHSSSDDEFTYSYIDIPRKSIQPLQIIESLDVNITDDGKMIVDDYRVFHGSASYYEIYRFYNKSSDDKARIYKSKLNYKNVTLDFKKLELENLKINSSAQFAIKSNYVVGNSVVFLPDEIVVQTNGILGLDRNYMTIGDTVKRENNVIIYESEEMIRKINIHFPKTWKPLLKDSSYKVIYKIGSIDWKIDYTPGLLTYQIKRSINEGLFEPLSFSELLEIQGTHGKLFDESIVFSKQDN